MDDQRIIDGELAKLSRKLHKAILAEDHVAEEVWREEIDDLLERRLKAR